MGKGPEPYRPSTERAHPPLGVELTAARDRVPDRSGPDGPSSARGTDPLEARERRKALGALLHVDATDSSSSSGSPSVRHALIGELDAKRAESRFSKFWWVGSPGRLRGSIERS